MAEHEMRRWLVSGRVQGVGFRFWACERARALALGGWVRNLRDGSVETVAAGPGSALDRFEAELRRGPDGAEVRGVLASPWRGAAVGAGAFEQRDTADAAGS